MANYIRRVRVAGLFNQETNLVVNFDQSINCIYGVNGTGKTVLINLIVNALRVNVPELINTPFNSVTILTSGEGKKKPENFLTVSKFGDELRYVFHDDHKIESEFFIGHEKITKLSSDVIYVPSLGRQRQRMTARQMNIVFDDEQTVVPHQLLRGVITRHISLTYVPLLRHSSSKDYGIAASELRQHRISDDDISEIIDPNTQVLKDLQEEFSRRYASAQSDIARRLESLSSIIFEKLFLTEQTLEESSGAQEFISKFLQKGKTDKDSDKVESVINQIRDLHLKIPERNIRNHYKTWFEMQSELLVANKAMLSLQVEDNTIEDDERSRIHQKWTEAYFNLLATSRVYEKLEDAMDEIQKVFLSKQLVLSPFNQFKQEVNNFLSGSKEFSFDDSGQFRFMNHGRELNITKLSSGEKHLLAILGRVCFSSFSVTSTFIADEPELSLHLEWQRKILPAIRRLSPNTQVIVATHAPAIISKDAHKIDIEECYRNG